MAVANAGAKRVLSSKLGGDVKQAPGLAKDKIALIVGGVIAAVFFVIAAMDALGVLNIEIRPGEGAGINPAFDFIVLGLLGLMGPYGVVASGQIRRVNAIERRLPDFLRDVAE